MFPKQLKWAAAAGVLGAHALALHAQMAQDPLLSRTATVEPNIVFLFDDSASMQSTAIYQYGIGTGYQGSRGPNGDAECLPFQAGCVWTQSPPPSPYGRSPDVNLIYYDPRVQYTQRVRADGTFQAATALPNNTSFNVYFYKPPSTSRISFPGGNLAVTSPGSGYGNAVVGTLVPAPAAGGSPGTVSVTTATTNHVSSISITDGGWYRNNPNGSAVTFSGGGGSGASFTVNNVTATNNGVTNIAVSTSNTQRFSVASMSPINCTVAFINVGGGTGATATAILPAGLTNRHVSSITVTNPGGNYGGSTAARITCSGQTRDAGTVTRGTTYRIAGTTATSTGQGYTTAPTVNFPSAGSPGRTATGTAAIASTRFISGVTITGGSGYSACPTVQLSNTAGGTGAVIAAPACVTTTVVGVNTKWDGTLNPNGLAAGRGPVNNGDYFNSYVPDAGSPLAAGANATTAYPTTASSATANYPKFKNRTDCTGTTCTWADELRNYSNWRAFHSTRLELAKTGIGLAFQPLNPTFRLGWATLGQAAGRASTSSQCGVTTAQLQQGVMLYDGATQANFLNWLYGINNAAASVLCTPSRHAVDNVGNYFRRRDDNGPWARVATGNNSLTQGAAPAVTTHATCRRSYAMLMTDGYYNDANGPSPFSLSGSAGDYDSTNGPIHGPRSFGYTPIGPFSDSPDTNVKHSHSLADTAMKHWVQDLRPDLENAVRPVAGDEAFWQHMNFYSIGLGLVGTLDATSPTVLQSLTGHAPSRTRQWPTPSGDRPEAIDDMWHASLNGRGKMLNAKTAAELNASIQQMMSDISGKEGTQSGVAVSAPSLTKNTRKYTPKYTPISWTGNITAFNLNQTNANQSSIAWEVETEVTDPVTNEISFSSRMPPAATRNIYAGTGTASPRAVPFKYADLTAAMRTAMGGASVNTDLINYLRGDASQEDTSAAADSPTAIYRARKTRLGDIVNSTPVFVKDSVDLKYDLLPAARGERATYQALVTRKKARAEGVLFVGANDGMLHAFRDGTYDANGSPIAGNPGGIEVFAYVPNALLPTLPRLASKTYVHQYYVDGPNTETDGFLTVAGRWANIVLGSTGAGAGAPAVAGTSPRTAVFAIDVTALENPASMNASNVMWEVSSSNPSFAELGYVLTDIQAGVTPSGKWIAVFGNGYESRSCQARLYVVDLETGAFLREINTGAGACAAGQRNGLGGVRLVKDANQQVVGAYAGDLLGNMWKFNLSGGTTASWTVDLAGQPLMKTGGKPITAPPTIINLPLVGTTEPTRGYMVVFGTGKFYEVADITDLSPQTLYGIWDPLLFGETPIPAGTALTDNSRLEDQIVESTHSSNGSNFFKISTDAVPYSGGSAKRGWYLNLPNSGQRLVYPIELLSGRFALADTISPANVSLDPCSNESGGAGFIYIVDAMNGGGPTEPILDTNGDGNVTSADLVVSGLESTADGRNVSIVVSSSDSATTYANLGGGTPGSTLIQISCRLTGTCKIPAQPIRHQWRQLFLR